MMRSPMYGPHAGFATARHGQTLFVSVPRDWPVDVHRALDGWNMRAHWKLFCRSDEDVADIKVQDPTQNDYPPGIYSVMLDENGQFTKKKPYRSALIMTDEHHGFKTISHELGHCLGFRHRVTGIMGPLAQWADSDVNLLMKGGYYKAR